MDPSATKKLVQVSEEIQKPVHVPIVLGNECFIVTQQDVRKIEDARFISYHKLGPNGELIPVETTVGQDIALKDAINMAGAFHNQQHMQQQILEAVRRGCSQRQPDPKASKASIAQQMEWANAYNHATQPPFPFTQSACTSMSDMPLACPTCCCKRDCCCCCASRKPCTNKGSNTSENTADCNDDADGSLSARQMLKIRKCLEDNMGM